MKRAIVVAAALLAAGCIALTIAAHTTRPANEGLSIFLGGALVAAGLVIARQQPRNAIAWLLAGTGLIALVDVLVRLYLVLDFRQHGGTLPLGWVAVEWRGGIAITPFLIGLVTILLFPDGRVPSRRWRIALWIYGVGGAAFALVQLADMANAAGAHHPGVNATGQVSVGPGHLADEAWLLAPYFLAFWVASVVHQVRQWRRADGDRRAQLKWLMSGAAVCVASAVLVVNNGDSNTTLARVLTAVGVLGISFMPISIGIAILKYRLYEIDRLISRTLSYTIVTGLLAGTFVGLVVLITDVLPFSSPVAVAASTLAAAALFNPLRVRVQRVVDRRFNRARFDAERTVESFARRLRDAVEIDTVQAGLIDAVNDAVEPAHVELWMRSTS